MPRRGVGGPGNGFVAEVVDVPGEEVLVVHGHGELDLANRHEVRSAVADALRDRRSARPVARPRPVRLVIDLSGVTHLGATVIAALVEEAERSPSRHAPRLVVGRQGVVARVAALLDLGEHFEVVETLADAVPAPGPAR